MIIELNKKELERAYNNGVLIINIEILNDGTLKPTTETIQQKRDRVRSFLFEFAAKNANATEKEKVPTRASLGRIVNADPRELFNTTHGGRELETVYRSVLSAFVAGRKTASGTCLEDCYYSEEGD